MADATEMKSQILYCYYPFIMSVSVVGSKYNHVCLYTNCQSIHLCITSDRLGGLKAVKIKRATWLQTVWLKFLQFICHVASRYVIGLIVTVVDAG